MENFVLLQIFVNLVLFANILYLHRARASAARRGATPVLAAPPAPPPAETPRRRKRGGLVLTLGLGSSASSFAKRPGEPAVEPPPATLPGLDALVSETERVERALASVPEPADSSRQRAAEELRASIRRLQLRLDTSDLVPATRRAEAPRT